MTPEDSADSAHEHHAPRTRDRSDDDDQEHIVPAAVACRARRAARRRRAPGPRRALGSAGRKAPADARPGTRSSAIDPGSQLVRNGCSKAGRWAEQVIRDRSNLDLPRGCSTGCAPGCPTGFGRGCAPGCSTSCPAAAADPGSPQATPDGSALTRRRHLFQHTLEEVDRNRGPVRRPNRAAGGPSSGVSTRGAVRPPPRGAGPVGDRSSRTSGESTPAGADPDRAEQAAERPVPSRADRPRGRAGRRRPGRR